VPIRLQLPRGRDDISYSLDLDDAKGSLRLDASSLEPAHPAGAQT
jgi:hypothetical protein